MTTLLSTAFFLLQLQADQRIVVVHAFGVFPNKAKQNTPSITPPPPPLRDFEVDTVKAFQESTFPIAPTELIERAKDIMSPDIALGLQDDGNCLADDFQFVAAVVGPLDKSTYLTTLASFQLEDSFDIQQNMFGWTVSPIQTNRVYFFVHQVAKQIADFVGTKPEDLKYDVLVLPPQCFHLDFNENGQVTEFGFYTVDRSYGNTGGLGGAVGFLYGVGRPLPYPESYPYEWSWQRRIFTFIVDLFGLGPPPPSSSSSKDDDDK